MLLDGGGVFESGESFDCRGNRLRRELDLVNIKLLVHHIAKLLIVHLPSAQHLQCLVLKRLIGHALRCLHLVLDVHQLLVALVHFGLDHF